ncbi:Deoxycytidylate deaminase [Linum grandiflorum]
MNPREVVLVSTATVLGALSYALALHFFSSFKPKLSASQSSSNGEATEKCLSQSPFDPSKRKRYLSWDDYFMAIAFLSAERSKDPNRQQVGACLVSQNGVILGIGYNGFPRGCSDDKLPWAKKSKNGDPLETKYPYVCHAEVNAVLNTNHASAAGQRLYVTMYPCNECAKIIIQSGVSEVIYFIEKNMSSSDVAYVASRKLLSLAGVKVRKHQPQTDRIFINFQDPL